jgi:hypothetical protein
MEMMNTEQYISMRRQAYANSESLPILPMPTISMENGINRDIQIGKKS